MALCGRYLSEALGVEPLTPSTALVQPNKSSHMDTSFSPDFFGTLRDLAPYEHSHINATIDRYTKSPGHPSLNLEQLKGRAGQRRLWTIRASRELRILLARQGAVTVFLRAGHHDAIYRLARQSAFVVPVAGAPGLMPVARQPALDEDTALPSRTSDKRSATVGHRSIVNHWLAKELEQAGFTESEIEKLRQATQDTLFDVWPELENDEDKWDLICKCCEGTPEAVLQGSLLPDEEAENARFREAIVQRGALAGLSSLLTPEEVERLMSAPIEEWMVFLHPDQRTLVDRRFNGPARVRGAAGTGKTVVALHRAAALAARYGTTTPNERPPVLFTTFIRSLPPVLEMLYSRLPNRVAGGVEFVNVDKLANRLCREAGQQPRLDPNAVNKAFNQAYNAVVQPNTPLHGQTREYLQEEIAAVLKARGVASLDDYLQMERTGRKSRFTAPMREQAWALHQECDRLLAEAGVQDFPDVLRRARDIARRRREPMFRAAVVDEAQDLSLVALQLVDALVSDGNGERPPDSLFLVGDGAQKIYPGGFTLAQAGLDVRGNSAVLRVNYRNTQEIIAAAMACTGSEPVNDLGDTFLRGDAETETQREGIKPFLVCAGDFQAQINYVAGKIKQLCSTAPVAGSDIGVFVAHNSFVNRTKSRLNQEGVQSESLADFSGPSNDRVKVGTFHRAKGLEFKVVFLLEISAGEFPAPHKRWQTEAEYEERRTLEMSQLFVAMTRARDGLFILCNAEPSDVLYAALDYLEEVDA